MAAAATTRRKATAKEEAPKKEADPEPDSDMKSFPSTSTADFPEFLEADIDREYLEVPMHKCCFLMAIDDDHLLLNDVRIKDEESRDTCRALVDTSGGELPQEPHRYQFVPWMRHISGDILKYEDDEYELAKIFLVKKKEDSDMLDLDTVVCLDAEERQMGRVAVERNCPDDVPEDQLMLRIREGSLILEPSAWALPPGEVVGMHEYGGPPANDEEDPELPQQEVISASSENKMEEMDDDMDGGEDAPAVDLA